MKSFVSVEMFATLTGPVPSVASSRIAFAARVWPEPKLTFCVPGFATFPGKTAMYPEPPPRTVRFAETDTAPDGTAHEFATVNVRVEFGASDGPPVGADRVSTIRQGVSEKNFVAAGGAPQEH